MHARHIIFGLLDVVAASASAFLVGLVAIHSLTSEELGAYSLLYLTAVVAAVGLAQATFIPFERSVATEEIRLGDVIPYLRLTTVVALTQWLALCVAVGIMTAYLRATGGNNSTLILGAGAALLVLTSPWQDHVRRLCHIMQYGGLAALASLVQLLAVVALVGIAVVGVDDYGALVLVGLALANLISLVTSLILLVRRLHFHGAGTDGRLRLAWRDRPKARLLVAGLSPQLAGVAAGLLLQMSAGLAAVGAWEAARQLAQPIFVLGAGIMTVAARYSFRFAAVGDRSAAIRVRRYYLLAIVPSAVTLFVIVALWPSTSDFVRGFAPAAFSAFWLLPITYLAHVLTAFAGVTTNELVGAQLDDRLRRMEISNGIVSLTIAAAAVWVGAVSRPLGIALGALMRNVWARLELDRAYRLASGQHRLESLSATSTKAESPPGFVNGRGGG